MRLINYIEKLRPENVFLSIGLCFGLLFIIITPPFQIPDEINHFYRAYQVSEGHFASVKQDNRVGDSIPVSLVDCTGPFSGLFWNENIKTSFNNIKIAREIPLNTSKKLFVDFPNTALYSPMCYLPQAFSIFILRIFNSNPITIFYGARLFTLLFWVCCVFLAIKIIPVYKWLMCFIALLPMSIFINMSLSADVVTNTVAFLFIAFVLKLAFNNGVVTNKQLILLHVLICLLVSVKLVYTPLVLILFIIPKSKFKAGKNFYYSILSVSALLIVSLIFWTKVTNNLYTPYDDYNPLFRDNITIIRTANMYQQKEFIFNNGFYIFRVFLNSMKHSFNMYFESYVGTFGWLDTKMPVWFIYISYIFLFAVAVIDGNKDNRIKLKHKIYLVLSVFITLCLVLLSQHLTWDPVGGEIIGTIQGRYLIPFAPLLFMLFHNSISKKRITACIVIFYAVFGLSYSAYVIYHRYFFM